MTDNSPKDLSLMLAEVESHEGFTQSFLSVAHLPANVASTSYLNLRRLQSFSGSSFEFQPSVPAARGNPSGFRAAGAEKVKCRRTKSGCLTCRGRKVKCDETRPICERCRKGSRTCVYPAQSAGQNCSGSRTATTESNLARSSSSLYSEDTEQDEAKPSVFLPLMSDGGNEDDDQKKMTLLKPLEKTSQPLDFQSILGQDNAFSILPDDYRAHLQYLDENVDCHHYRLSNETDSFFVRCMIIEASRNRLLLNALAAFSSYIRAVQEPDGELYDFLLYYNRSISLLLECLQQEETHGLMTLLSILQLTTIEEYLGDWANMMGHQKAALELFTKLFTPQTVMETRIGRICLCWYTRFDVDISLFGTKRSNFSRDWLVRAAAFYQQRIEEEPGEMEWRAGDRWARLQLIRYDMSALFYRDANGEISGGAAEFAREHEDIATRLAQWREAWDPILTTADLKTCDFWWRQQRDPDGIVEPYEPGLLYLPPLVGSTFASAEWHMLSALHTAQTPTVPRDKLLADVIFHSLAVCQLFEAVRCWPLAPEGLLLGIGSLVTVAALFLSKDERHWKWLCQRLAELEISGSIQSMSFRLRMAAGYHDSNMTRWWLPDDRGFSLLLQSIRNFADERHRAMAVDAHVVICSSWDVWLIGSNKEEIV